MLRSISARFANRTRSLPKNRFGSTFRRDPRFSQINEADLEFFKSKIGAQATVTDPAALQPMNIDWMKKYQGHSQLALKPGSVQEISSILQYCNERSLAVVPQGGNTGLVGGGVPIFDEVILSLSRLNQVISFDETSGILVCEAGCILENLDNFLAERGFTMPLDLGAKGSCQIGGNVSTNAGGLRYVRYGSLHGSVLGLEAVLANGTVVDCLSRLRKDNTGYDLKQLFIGAEGTLGVVTKVALLVPAKPKNVQVAYVGCASYQHVLKALIKAKKDLAEILSAVEFQDRLSLDLVLKHIKGARDPLSSKFPFYMLIETAGSNAEHDAEKLSQFLESSMEEGLVEDGILAQDASQSKALWLLRESVAESAGRAGSVYKYDVSLPVSQMYELVDEMRLRMGSEVECVGYGHLGDGNLHLNVVVPAYSDSYLAQVEPFVFERVAANRGSISAEHGIGQCKPQYLHFSKTHESISLMRQIKQIFDPKGILNPYKVIPQ